DHMSLFGYPRPTTPRIADLASRGVAFRNVVPSGCSTKTSLTSLLTGLSYETHRLIDRDARLDGSYLTVAEVLRARGYQTAGFVATPPLGGEMTAGGGFALARACGGRGEGFAPGEWVERGALAWLAPPARAGARPFSLSAPPGEPPPPWRHAPAWS